MQYKNSLLFLDNADNILKKDAKNLGNLITAWLEAGDGRLFTIMINSNFNAHKAFENTIQPRIANVFPMEPQTAADLFISKLQHYQEQKD